MDDRDMPQDDRGRKSDEDNACASGTWRKSYPLDFWEAAPERSRSKFQRNPLLVLDNEAWGVATQGLTLEEKGFVLGCLILLHETGREDLPDDRMLGHYLHVDMRVVRRLRPVFDRIPRHLLRAPRKPISRRDREKTQDAANGRRIYCGEPGTEVDHHRPLSRGGANHRKNFRWTCTPCNRGKRAALPRELAP